MAVIELNGKRYDANTGKLLESAKPSAKSGPSPHHKAATSTHPNRGTALDGVSRRPTTESSSPHNPHKTTNTATKSHRPNPHQRGLQKSQTLMRPGLKYTKPAIHNKEVSNQPPQAPYSQHLERRVRRAKSFSKSQHISRFGTAKIEGVVKRHTSLPVVEPKVDNQPTQKQVIHHQSAQGPIHSALENFEKAAAEASHDLVEFTHSTPRRRSWIKSKASLAAASLAVLLLGGFFAYQNIPNLQMRVATARAGFSANLPTYKPEGYGIMGGIQAEPGRITINFHSKIDEKAYQITQRASDWSSETLRNNQLAASGQSYQTYEEQGKTVYIYGGTNATWVDAGVWYQVEGDAPLTNDQLLRIANSF